MMELNELSLEPIKRNHVYPGHVLDILKRLPDACVHNIITSIPYWGPRNYEIESQIFGGVPDCKHEWSNIPSLQKCTPGDRPSPNSILPQNYIDNYETVMRPSKDSQYCIHCNAWFGDWGLEPSFQMYLDHTLEILDECYRVLVPWGNFFLNVGDSYSKSGGTGNQYDDYSKFEDDDFTKITNYNNKNDDLPSRCQVSIPERLKIELTNPNWILRDDIPLEKQVETFTFLAKHGILSTELSPGQIPPEIKEYFKPKRKYGSWICRNDNIWAKAGPMPSSDETKFTPDHEYVYYFCKTNDITYYYNDKNCWLTQDKPLNTKGVEGIDWDWIPCPNCESNPSKCSKCKGTGIFKDEPCKKCDGTGTCHRCNGELRIKDSHWISRKNFFNTQFEKLKNPGFKRITSYGGVEKSDDETKEKYNSTYSGKKMWDATQKDGKYRRSTWRIATASFPGAHFAVFPPALARIMMDAGTPEFVCKECGMPMERVITKTTSGKSWHDHSKDLVEGQSQAHGEMSRFYAKGNYKRNFLGYSDCHCNAGFKRGIVMDICFGSGTSGYVAKRTGGKYYPRDYVGIEINPEYIEMAKLRIKIGDKKYRQHVKKEREMEKNGQKRLFD